MFENSTPSPSLHTASHSSPVTEEENSTKQKKTEEENSANPTGGNSEKQPENTETSAENSLTDKTVDPAGHSQSENTPEPTKAQTCEHVTLTSQSEQSKKTNSQSDGSADTSTNPEPTETINLTNTSSTVETAETKPKPLKRKSFVEMLGIVVLAFGVCLQYTVCSRLLNVQEPPRVLGKWTARDLQLPHEPYFTNIRNGDIALLDRMLAQHDMSVVVYYAPWSRPSHRVLENLSELSTTMPYIKFIAVNCWLYHSLCRDNFNSWDYPQVMIYHRIIEHIPYVYGLSTFPPSFREQLNRFTEPVIFVYSVEQLTAMLMSHQRSVIALFSSSEEGSDFREFEKAALIHHLEYIDTYYVPFIVLDTDHADVLDRAELNNVVFKHVLFQPLSRYEAPILRHRDLLSWLRDPDPPLHYLSHNKFSDILYNNVSVMYAGPLYRSTDNLVTYMQSVMSYRSCPVEAKLKIHCKPNRTCLNPCVPDNSLTTNTILPCFSSSVPPPSSVQQCFYRDRLFGSSEGPSASKLSEDFTLLQRSFLESDVMCSVAQDRQTCLQCDGIEELNSMLDAALSHSCGPIQSPHHGHGCSRLRSTRHRTFYTLDSVLWADMLTRMGVNNTDKSNTEALIKIHSGGESVHAYDLTNETLAIEKLESFIWGDDEVNEAYLETPSKRGEEASSRGTAERDEEEIAPEYIRDISREKLLVLEEANDYLIFVYTKWCGYCHVMQRKLEVAARLLRDTPLQFLAIDSDANSLSDTIVATGSVPSLFLLSHDAALHSFTPPQPDKPPSVREIVDFIKGVVPGSQFSDSSGPEFPVLPARPCSTWRPEPAPVFAHPLDSQATSKLGLSDSTFHDILNSDGPIRGGSLESNSETAKPGPQHGSCPLQTDWPAFQPDLRQLADTKLDNLPNRMLDAKLAFDANSAVLESRVGTCRAARHLFKALAVSSVIDPQSLAPVTITLFTDLYRYRCLEAPVHDTWDYVALPCAKGARDSIPCRYLAAANILVNYHSFTPPHVLQLLAAKYSTHPTKNQRKSGRAKQATCSLMTSSREIVTFNLKHCYNIRAEMVHYLTGACSVLCGLQCRIVNHLL